MRTDVNVYPMEGKGKLKAMASLMVSGHLAVTGIRLMESENSGLYVKMPSYRTQEYDSYGRQIYKEYVVLAKELYSQVKDQIVSAYQNIHAGYEPERVRMEDLAFPTPTIRVTKIEREPNSRAKQGEVSVVVGGQLFINGIRVLRGKNGNYFLGMPNYPSGTYDDQGRMQYHDVCFPITKDMRQQMNQVVLGEFIRDTEWDVKADDKIAEFRSSDGSRFYLHFSMNAGAEAVQNLYREDFKKIATASLDTPVMEFLAEYGIDTATHMCVGKGTELNALKDVYDRSRMGGVGFNGILSEEEKQRRIGPDIISWTHMESICQYIPGKISPVKVQWRSAFTPE